MSKYRDMDEHQIQPVQDRSYTQASLVKRNEIFGMKAMNRSYFD